MQNNGILRNKAHEARPCCTCVRHVLTTALRRRALLEARFRVQRCPMALQEQAWAGLLLVTVSLGSLAKWRAGRGM